MVVHTVSVSSLSRTVIMAGTENIAATQNNNMLRIANYINFHTPSLSTSVTVDVWFPRLRLAPESVRDNTSENFSSDSTRLSGLTVTETHFSAPSAEPIGKVTGVDSESKSPLLLVAVKCNVHEMPDGNPNGLILPVPSTADRVSTSSSARVAEGGVALMVEHTINVGLFSVTLAAVGIVNSTSAIKPEQKQKPKKKHTRNNDNMQYRQGNVLAHRRTITVYQCNNSSWISQSEAGFFRSYEGQLNFKIFLSFDQMVSVGSD